MRSLFQYLHRVVLCLCLLAFAISATATAHAASSKFRKKSRARVRLLGTLGYINYSSGNFATNVQSAAGGAEVRTEIEGFQLQGQVQSDIWISNRIGLLQHLEILRIDFQGKDSSFQGQPIFMAANDLQLAVRIAGAKGTPSMGSEIVAAIGPEASHFSDVRSHWDQPQYERVPVTLLGLNIGARARLALFKRTALQLAGSWNFPIAMFGNRGELQAGDSRIVRYSVIYDFAITRGIAVGGGFVGSLSRMSYLPATQNSSQTIEMVNYGFIGSVMFSF